MKYATLSDIKSLIAKPKNSLSISIFLPTYRVGLPHNLKADRVRMKNAIRDIKATLSEKLSPREVRRYTKQLERLHADRNFWRFRDNGLALFVANEKMTHFDLPAEVDNRVHVDEHFVITPLLATMQEHYTYYVVELNRHEPRFFIADEKGVNRALMDELPGNMKNALLIDEFQNQLQHASGTVEGGVHYHGHGGAKDKDRIDLERYIRLINDVLWQSVLHDSNRPLVLMGDIKSVELYRSITLYKHIVDEYVKGNYEHSSPEEIHHRTWKIIEKKRRSEARAAKEIMEKARARDNQQLLVNNSSIKKAARRGRIGTLVISMVGRTYDSVVRSMEKRYKISIPSNMRQLANIETIAREVLSTGGDVTSVIRPDSDHTENYIKAITRPGGKAV